MEETKDASAAALKLSDQEEAQHKAALDKGADAEKAAEVKAEVKAVLGKSDTSLSGDYEQTVQKAMTADLKRRAADRKARNAFRTERAKKLAADTAKEGQLFDTMAKVSAAIMQPSQLENVKRVEEGRDTVCYSLTLWLPIRFLPRSCKHKNTCARHAHSRRDTCWSTP